MIVKMNPKMNRISLKIAGVLAFSVLVVLVLAVFANSMTKPLGHDEQMYCTAGFLLAQGKMIYRDFSYVAQMPYHPLLCAGIFKLLNTTYYLLTVRITSSLCDVFIIICIIGIYCRAFGYSPAGLLLGLAGAVMYVFNPFVDYANGFAWNHDLITLCVIFSFWIFQNVNPEGKTGYWPVAAIAALLTLATCARPTTALVQLLFFAALLIQQCRVGSLPHHSNLIQQRRVGSLPHHSNLIQQCRVGSLPHQSNMIQKTNSAKQKATATLIFLAVTAFLLIWPAWTILSAPRAFFLNLFRVPLLNSRFLHQTGVFYKKSEMIFIFLTTYTCFSLVLIAFYLFLSVVWNRKKLKIPDKTLMIFACLLTIVFFIIAFIPPTIWPQYFAAPVLFLIVSFAYPLSYLRKLPGDRFFIIAVVLLIAGTLTAVSSNPVVLERIPQLLAPQTWQPIQLHNISQDIAGKTKTPKLALTLGPLYAIEGGCKIYTEFSTGPFVYRIADYLSPSDRRLLNAVGPKSLDELPQDSTPAVMILGLEPEFLEAPLYQHIKPDNAAWDAKSYDAGPTAYFRR